MGEAIIYFYSRYYSKMPTRTQFTLRVTFNFSFKKQYLHKIKYLGNHFQKLNPVDCCIALMICWAYLMALLFGSIQGLCSATQLTQLEPQMYVMRITIGRNIHHVLMKLGLDYTIDRRFHQSTKKGKKLMGNMVSSVMAAAIKVKDAPEKYLSLSSLCLMLQIVALYLHL